MRRSLIVVAFAASMTVLAAERAYEFRRDLCEVHAPHLRDPSVLPQADEFVFGDGTRLSIPADADEVLYAAARDFEDYLWTSMGVSACVVAGSEANVTIALDAKLAERQSKISVTRRAVRIRARDSRAAAQALYHLEDLMNLRRAPFLSVAEEDRTQLFSPRMTHSGFACDEFPDAYLRKIAHAGMDAIVVFVRDVDKTKGHPQYQDVNDVIRRAKAIGIDTYLYSYVHAFAHPRDPGAAEVFENSFGRVSKAYPEAKGFVLVGESCEFPSKDPRVIPIEAAKRGKAHEGDTRPMAGYFPCSDYHEWVGAVQKAIRRYNPSADIVFWTYNWGSQPLEPRLSLIDSLGRDVSLLVTYEMFEPRVLPNGFESVCDDYTVSFAGPGRYFVSEAECAKRNSLALYAMSNTGGRTWDYGMAPYLPHPYQWKRRWDGLVKAHADWGLRGLMESHHYGWQPSFVSELAKEAFVRGGIPFDEHIRRIAVRDFGETNVEAVLKVWRDWSRAITLQPGTCANQYAMFRMGPAYPFNALGPRIRDPFSCGKDADPEIPFCTYAVNGARHCRLNYADDQMRQWIEGLDYFPRLNPSEQEVARETEALKEAAGLYIDGASMLRRLATSLSEENRRRRAEKIAGVGEFMGRTCLTAAHIKCATRLEDIFLSKSSSDDAKAKARAEIRALARIEYENARAALRLLEADSSLGWEPTMEYLGGVEMMRWKLRRMEKLYGLAPDDN